MYDVAIIGAGPAGATLARLIADRYRVLLVDRRRPVGTTGKAIASKCCGGLLAPDAQKMLSKMGLGLPRSVLVDPQLFVVRAIDIQQRFERYYQRFYVNMDRQKFDSWLLSLLPPAIDIKLGCRFKSYEPGYRGFKIKLLEKQNVHIESARIIVGADGAASHVRRQALSHKHAMKLYVAIQQWVEVNSQLPYFSSIFDPSLTDYYCWTIPKGRHLMIGAALQPNDQASKKFELLKQKLHGFGYQFGKTIRREGASIMRPVNRYQLTTGTKGIALLGEAAGWISPSSAEGLSYAFRSALMLADALRKAPEGFEKRYYLATRRLRINIFLKNIKSHFIFNPLLRNAVMRSGLNSLEIYQP